MNRKFSHLWNEKGFRKSRGNREHVRKVNKCWGTQTLFEDKNVVSLFSTVVMSIAGEMMSSLSGSKCSFVLKRENQISFDKRFHFDFSLLSDPPEFTSMNQKQGKTHPGKAGLKGYNKRSHLYKSRHKPLQKFTSWITAEITKRKRLISRFSLETRRFNRIFGLKILISKIAERFPNWLLNESQNKTRVTRRDSAETKAICLF